MLQPLLGVFELYDGEGLVMANECSAVAEFKEKDFSLWYDTKKDRISYITEKKSFAEGFQPILHFNQNERSMVAGAKEYAGKKYVICMADLRT